MSRIQSHQATDRNHPLMRALIATGYGGTEVLELTDRGRPTPVRNELLVRVVATSVTAADSMMRRGDPAYARLFLGLMRPKAAIPGTGFAGIVEGVGPDANRFQIGDAVFGEAGLGFGAHAEFVCVSEDGAVVQKPSALSFVDASAMCDGPLTSYNFLRRLADVQPGQHVLVNGASGSLGTAAVQLAKSLGAVVTGVCSGANVELVRSLGADVVIDYTQDDFTEARNRYDVVYDTVGKSSFRRCKKALKRRGIYMSPVLSFPLLARMLWTRVIGNKTARFDATGLRPAQELRGFLAELLPLAESGALRLVIDSVLPLEDIASAHARVDTGRKVGAVVVLTEDRSRASQVEGTDDPPKLASRPNGPQRETASRIAQAGL